MTNSIRSESDRAAAKRARKASLTSLTGRLLLASAIGSVWALAAAPQSAQAQFVCVGSDDGDPPLTAAGALADSSVGNVACGTSANARGENSANTALGDEANAFGDGVDGDEPTGNTAVGHGSIASGGTPQAVSRNVAVGFEALAFGEGSNNTATGQQANASGGDSANTATGDRALAFGEDSFNIATGGGANASGNDSANTATGFLARADGEFSRNIAMGGGANARGDGLDSANETSNIAIGDFSIASGGTPQAVSHNVAVGFEALAFGEGTRNTAVGALSTATGPDSTAVGTNASATHAYSAAFGHDATTSRANQQVFGTANNTYTMPGITSAASTAAQEPVHGLVTTDANGNLASDGGTLQRQVDRHGNDIDENSEGVAMAMAMAGTFLPQPGESVRLSGNWGNFEGSNAVAFSGAMALGAQTFLTAGVGVGLEEDTVGGRAGVSYGW